jgi:hypothetical protein
VSVLDIDRDAAHDAAQRELAKPIYPKESLTERLSGWIEELLYRIAAEGSRVPGGWFTVTILAMLLVVAVVVAVRIARRTLRTRRVTQTPLFAGQDRTAAEYRSAAEQFAASGDWAMAIRHRLRAVGRQLEEDGVLTAVPGRTATELAGDAGRALPHLAGELSSAAEAFNDVSYGGRPGTPPAYRLIADLDDHLRRPASAGHVAAAPVGGGWAEIR